MEREKGGLDGLIIYSTTIKPAVYMKNLNTGNTEMLLERTENTGDFGITVNPSFDQMVYSIREITSDNRINITTEKDSQFYLMDLETRTSKPLTGKLVEPDFFSKELIKYKAKVSNEEIPVMGTNPAWSPDGSKLAYTKVSFPEIGVQDLYVYDFEKKEIRPLAYNIHFDMNPQWASDSKTIIYETNEGLPGDGFVRDWYSNFRNFSFNLDKSSGELFSEIKGVVAEIDEYVFVLEDTLNGFIKYDIAREVSEPVFFYQTEDTTLISRVHKQLDSDEKVLLTFSLFEEFTDRPWLGSTHWEEYIGFYDFKEKRFIKLETFTKAKYINNIFWKDLPNTARGNNYF
ncbi:MAG: hypothetical protein BalsKO_29400 [Balneolaceae bacterium]